MQQQVYFYLIASLMYICSVWQQKKSCVQQQTVPAEHFFRTNNIRLVSWSSQHILNSGTLSRLARVLKCRLLWTAQTSNAKHFRNWEPISVKQTEAKRNCQSWGRQHTGDTNTSLSNIPERRLSFRLRPTQKTGQLFSQFWFRHCICGSDRRCGVGSQRILSGFGFYNENAWMSGRKCKKYPLSLYPRECQRCSTKKQFVPNKPRRTLHPRSPPSRAVVSRDTFALKFLLCDVLAHFYCWWYEFLSFIQAAADQKAIRKSQN